MAANTVKVAGKMYLCTKITAIFYYLQKDSGRELDFLIRYKGECVPVEVKAKTAQAKSIATVRKHPEKYGVKHFIKFGDYNIGRDGDLLTLPFCTPNRDPIDVSFLLT